MRTKVAYELGLGQFGNVKFASDGKSLVFPGTDTPFYLALGPLGAPHEGPRWGKLPIALAPRAPVNPQWIAECQSLASAPSIASRLMNWRQPAVPFTEADLRWVLQYELNGDESGLLAHVLQRAATNELPGATLWWRKYDLYRRLSPYAHLFSENPCLVASQSQVEAFVQRAFKPLTAASGAAIDLFALSALMVHRPTMERLQLLTVEKKDILIENLALSATSHPLLDGIFASKLYYLSKAVLSPVFGDKRGFYTDLTMVNRGSFADVLLVSTDPTTGEGTVPTSFGFQVKSVRTVDLGPTKDLNRTEMIHWRSHGKLFRGQLALRKLGDLKGFAPSTNAPDYQQMKADDAITGAMMISKNVCESLAKWIFQEYQNTYRRMGFVLESPTERNDGLKYFKNGVETGEFDYVIKEAHSDGDEKNLFRASNEIRVVVGRKTDDKGLKHVIHLISPRFQSFGNDILISNHDFGDWIRERQAKRSASLVYINASCSSYPKALNEIASAHSTALTVIPSLTTVYFMSTPAPNPKRGMIEGLHKMNDWGQIRKLMDQQMSPEHQGRDGYALPNEAAYTTQIRDRLGITLDAKVEIFDGRTGQKIDSDSFNTH